MDKWEWLERLLRQQTIGNEENELIQKLLKNYNLYSLTGRNKLALMLLLMRSSRDIAQAWYEYRARHRVQ